mmetsp:Transcript_14155/g.48784  ORF Transcript_14155/g.48784 Transcript_14155/m.48784 type:complete len:229 (+) Transcript_14155:492-1178(+)
MDRSLSFITSGSVVPCTVATRRTPRCVTVRAASTSCTVLSSSTITTCGLWFSTASLRISAWSPGRDTGIHRAEPIEGCGESPSPAISHVLSTTTTLRDSWSLSRRESSLSTVVFPTPGLPTSSTLLCRPSSTRKRAMRSTVPCTTRPILAATPMTRSGWKLGCVITLRRCSVPSIPLRLWLGPPSSANMLANRSRSAASHADSVMKTRRVPPLLASWNTASARRPTWT